MRPADGWCTTATTPGWRWIERVSSSTCAAGTATVSSASDGGSAYELRAIVCARRLGWVQSDEGGERPEKQIVPLGQARPHEQGDHAEAREHRRDAGARIGPAARR